MADLPDNPTPKEIQKHVQDTLDDREKFNQFNFSPIQNHAHTGADTQQIDYNNLVNQPITVFSNIGSGTTSYINFPGQGTGKPGLSIGVQSHGIANSANIATFGGSNQLLVIEAGFYSSAWGNIALNDAGGNVGIGNSSPQVLLDLGNAGTIKGVVRFAGSTSGNVTIQPAAVAGTWTLTLPTSAGSANNVLQTNGSGVTSWVASGTYANGQGARSNGGAATVTIAHGLGFTPKQVIFSTYGSGTTNAFSTGIYNGTTVSVAYGGNAFGNNSTEIIHIKTDATVSSTATIATDATNITLTFTDGVSGAAIFYAWTANT